MSDRKYRQSGYQDDDRGERGERRGGPPRRGPESGPRGRGLGAPTATVFRCAVCGAEQPPKEVELGSVCVKCGTDLHTCTHCRHFDSSAPAECRQPVVERVAAKAKANRCELFSAKAAKEFVKESPGRPASPDAAKAAFDNLFKF